MCSKCMRKELELLFQNIDLISICKINRTIINVIETNWHGVIKLMKNNMVKICAIYRGKLNNKSDGLLSIYLYQSAWHFN